MEYIKIKIIVPIHQSISFCLKLQHHPSQADKETREKRSGGHLGYSTHYSYRAKMGKKERNLAPCWMHKNQSHLVLRKQRSKRNQKSKSKKVGVGLVTLAAFIRKCCLLGRYHMWSHHFFLLQRNQLESTFLLLWACTWFQTIFPGSHTKEIKRETYDLTCSRAWQRSRASWLCFL